MHILLEGVIPHELSLMLHEFVPNFFSLDLLNNRIESFTYSTQEGRDKPSPIKPQMLSSSISQTCKLYRPKCIHYTLFSTASQMWVLAINLPLMIGDKVPPEDERWECFLLLLDILQVCTSKITSAGLAGYLEALICDHHQGFLHCYTASSFIPKMHYMVHFVQQIIR